MSVTLLEKLKRIFSNLFHSSSEECNQSQSVLFNAYFCFFTQENQPKLIHSGHKQTCMTFSELNAFVDSCALSSNYSNSINVVSDYLVATHKMQEDKQLLIEFRAAGWDSLLVSLLSIYNVDISSIIKQFKVGFHSQVDVYFMIRPSNSNIMDFANTCFSLNICFSDEPDSQYKLADVVDAFVKGVTFR